MKDRAFLLDRVSPPFASIKRRMGHPTIVG